MEKDMFELWDNESGNLVGSFPSEEAALAVVRQAVERYGHDAAMSLCLAKTSGSGRGRTIASGSGLERLASRRHRVPA